MRHLGAFIVLVVLAAPALAADAPPTEEQSIPWYRWLFLGERAKPMPPAPVVKPVPPPTPEMISRMQAAEKDVYQKRMEAIDKIKELALDRGDEAMLKKAEELDRQAFETYRERTAKLDEMRKLAEDRARLETPKDTRPATAQRPNR